MYTSIISFYGVYCILSFLIELFVCTFQVTVADTCTAPGVGCAPWMRANSLSPMFGTKPAFSCYCTRLASSNRADSVGTMLVAATS